MEVTADEKWYQSALANGLGLGLLCLGIGAGIGSCAYGVGMGIAEITKETPQLQTGHLNDNETPERFYTIDETICVVEKDGDFKFYEK